MGGGEQELFFKLFVETGLYYGAQVGLELTILLPQPPTWKDYKHTPTHLFLNKTAFRSQYCNQ